MPPGTFQVHKNFNGWNAAAQYNVTKWLGLKADFSGHYGKPVTLSSSAQSLVNALGITGFPPSAQSYSFLFGPVLSNRRGRFKPFVHALFGANRVSSSLKIQVPGFSIPGITVSDTAFAMAFGGGLDIKATDRFWIRVGQGDYLFTKHDFSGGVPGIATHQNNFRASAGVVFMIGGRSTPASVTPPARVARAAMPIPALGIAVSPRGDGKDGAEITEVAPGGVGEMAMLHVGDIINSVDGKAVRTPMELAAELSNRAAGSQIHLGYMFRTAITYYQKETVVILGGNH